MSDFGFSADIFLVEHAKARHTLNNAAERSGSQRGGSRSRLPPTIILDTATSRRIPLQVDARASSRPFIQRKLGDCVKESGGAISLLQVHAAVVVGKREDFGAGTISHSLRGWCRSKSSRTFTG